MIRWLHWGRGDENRDRKSQTDVFDFFGVIFVTHRGSCDDCDGARECVGGCVTKIALKKSTDGFDFFRHDFCYPLRVLRWLRWRGVGECVGGWVTKIATKKIELTFLIFFSHPVPPPPSQLQGPRICDIASSFNIFENLKFTKMFNEDAISRIRGSCDCDGWGGGEERGKDDENCSQKKSETMNLVGFSLTFTAI